MSDLISSLTSAARALDAQQYGLDVVGQNMANVNSPGYTRRTIDFAEVAPYTSDSAGGGVEVTGVRSLRDTLLERKLRQETSSEQREGAIADALSVVETALGESGSSIDARLTEFFDAFSTLSEDPTSAVARREVQAQSDGLAAGFRDIAGRLEDARRDVDQTVGATVDDINGLVERIAALNQTIATTRSTESLSPKDEQTHLIQQLSELVDISVITREDGGVDVAIGNGRPLVVGLTSFSIDKSATGPDGYLALNSGDMDITSEITGGKLGGLLQVRDVNIPDYQARLDDLAYNVADQVNTLHEAGFDQTGAAGGAFFSFSDTLTGTTGAAAALVLDSAIADDPRLIAAAGTADVGDNETARAIAALRDAKVLDGETTTLSDTWGQLVYQAGRDSKTASDEQKSRSEIVNQVEALRDGVSGVSLDEEATNMIKFQRAYEANAKFFSAVNSTLDVLFGMVGS